MFAPPRKLTGGQKRRKRGSSISYSTITRRESKLDNRYLEVRARIRVRIRVNKLPRRRANTRNSKST